VPKRAVPQRILRLELDLVVIRSVRGQLVGRSLREHVCVGLTLYWHLRPNFLNRDVVTERWLRGYRPLLTRVNKSSFVLNYVVDLVETSEEESVLLVPGVRTKGSGADLGDVK
jgi:hypothetical protein